MTDVYAGLNLVKPRPSDDHRESGMAQPAIAAALGVSLSTVNRAENPAECILGITVGPRAWETLRSIVACMTDASGAAALVARDWNRFIIVNVHERFTPGALEHPAIRHSRPLRQGRFVSCGPRQWESTDYSGKAKMNPRLHLLLCCRHW